MLRWKLAIVLIGCVMAVSCGKESAPEPPEETSCEIVAESLGEEEKAEADPSTGLEETTEPSSTEPVTTEAATIKPTMAEPATLEKETAEPETVESATTDQPTAAEIPGVAFPQKLVELLDYEPYGRFWGWRPNFLVGRFTDNVNEFQSGALEAIRYTPIQLKESLTRSGDADAFDQNLVEAEGLLTSRADKFWFPSAESQYEEALDNLQEFLNNL